MNVKELPYDISKVFDNPLPVHSYTSLSTFQQCITKYVLLYLLRLVPKTPNKNLVGGHAFHQGLAALIAPGGSSSPERRLKSAHVAIDKVFDKVLETPEGLLGNTPNLLDYARIQIHACTKAWYLQEIWKDFKVVELEKWIAVPPNTTINSPPLDRIVVKADGIIKYQKELAILENKTQATIIPQTDVVDNIALDFQAHIGVLIAKKRLKLNIQKFCYNIIAKPRHSIIPEDYEGTIAKMVEAMLAKPVNYLSGIIPVEVTQPDLKLCESNIARIMYRADNLTGMQVERNSVACLMYTGCEYAALCKQSVDGAKPATVFKCPAISQYYIREIKSLKNKEVSRGKKEKEKSKSKGKSRVKRPARSKRK